MKMKRFSLMLAALAGMVGLAYADVTYNPEAKLITDVTQLSTNCLWTDEYGLDKTLDGDLVSHFHSDAAEGRDFHSTDMWWQADLNRDDVTAFVMTLNPRTGDEVRDKGWDQRPDKIEVHISTDGTNWTQLTTLTGKHVQNDFEPDVYYVDMTTAHRYVRFIVRRSVKDDLRYFNFSEFQMYKSESGLHTHTYVDGFCSECGMRQTDYMQPDEGGYYNIGNAAQLRWFAGTVNDGEKAVNGRLTADIAMAGASWTPIGVGPTYNKTDNAEGVGNVGFAGTFDGQGHTIDGFTINEESEAVGLFGVVTGTVKNVNVNGVTFNATKDCRAGGIAGTVTASSTSAGLIENCSVRNSSILTGSRVCGGLVGAVCGGTVKACYALGNTLSGYGDRFGGISGDSRNDNGWNGTIISCYTDFPRVTSSQAGTTINSVAGVTAEILASGELAFQLNGYSSEAADVVWYQKIGTDTAPVTDATHGVVYTATQYRCDRVIIGDVKFTNNANDATTIPDHQFADGFCTVCNSLDMAYMQPVEGFYEIGTPAQLVWFSAFVNLGNTGANAKLTADIDMSGVKNFTPISSYSDTAGYPQLSYGGTFDGQGHEISNLTVTQDDPYELGLFGRMNGATVKNVGFVNANITSNASIRVGVLSGEAVTSNITNVYSRGNIVLTTSHEQHSGISGEAHQSNLTNCWSTYEGNLAMGSVASTPNCYGYKDVAEKATTGELCYLLNGSKSENVTWYQTLGENGDAYPVLNSTHGIVYVANDKNCNGTYKDETLTYANTEGKQDEHVFVDGICSVCENVDMNFAELKDDYYQIGNLAQFKWFAALVKAGNYKVNAALTADIDLAGIDFEPIGPSHGNNTTAYRGKFNGQGHTISNVTIHRDASSDIYVGLFSCVCNGLVENLIVKNVNITTEAETAIATGSIIGRNSSSTLRNLVALDVTFNLKTIGTKSKGSGGIIGYMSDAVVSTLDNSYTNFVGADGISSITTKGAKAIVTNCYGGEDITGITATGELCRKLNASETIYYQTLGEDAYPVLDSTHKPVYLLADGTYANSNFVEGQYQISTLADFKEFIQRVNSGENNANAVLIADIDYGTENTMIGTADTEKGSYAGTFDGQGHTIQINMTGTADYQTLFKYVGARGVIKNLVVKGTITSAYKFMSAIAGDCHGTIENCVADVTFNSSIEGDGTHGGLVGRAMNGAFIVNCLAKTTMNAPTTSMSGGLAGWMNGKASFENCLNINDWTIDESGCFTVGRNAASNLGRAYNVFYLNKLGDTLGGTQITADDLKSGKVCFLLNHDQSNIQWTQNIGEDDYPVPFKTRGQVYCSMNTKCDGTCIVLEDNEDDETYSNTPAAGVPTKHDLHAGFCSVCEGVNNNVPGITTDNASCKNRTYKGYWDPNFVKRDTDGYFMAKTVDDMIWLACTEPMYNEKFSVKLMNDIDYSAEGWWLNSTNWYGGVLDGQGHKLTIDIAGAGNLTALCPMLSGDVKNIWIDGKVSSSRTFAGTIFGETQNDATRGNGHATMTNVVSTVTVTNTGSGDTTTGGLGGRATCECFLTNCIFAGKLEAPSANSNGGLIGWASTTTHMNNCIQIGEYNTGANGCYTIARNPGNVAYDGPVFYLNELGTTAAGATKIEAADIASGALAFKANGDQSAISWFQTLPGDAFPVPFADHGQVYAKPENGYRCDATPLGDVVYTNEAQTMNIPDHQFAEGFCTVCNNLQPDYMTPNADGFYELTNGHELAWFSHKVSDEKKPGLNTLLKNDITMTDADNALFVGIGNAGDVAYTGTFDGQGYTIDNLKISRGSYSGLICYANGGATVKNLILGKDCEIKATDGYTGIIGGSVSGANGTVTMDRLGFEGTSIAGGPNAAGIIGVNMGSNATFVITNCYVTGTVQGGRESAAITGWTGGAKSTLANCWSTATVSGNDEGKDFFRNDETVPTNCYNHIDHAGTGKLNVFTAEQLKSGELAYTMGGVWRQTIGQDEHPVFDETHGIVKPIEATGYATMYLPETSVVIPTGVTAYTGLIDTPWIALRPITNIISAGTPVVLQGAQGFYSFVPTAEVTEVAENDLKGTAEPLTTDGTQYVLAEKDGVVGFYEATGTIPAGKAYIEYIGAGIKGFTLQGTGIENLNGDEQETVIYDLGGRRVQKAQKGIYIIKGRKVLK